MHLEASLGMHLSAAHKQLQKNLIQPGAEWSGAAGAPDLKWGLKQRWGQTFHSADRDTAKANYFKYTE